MTIENQTARFYSAPNEYDRQTAKTNIREIEEYNNLYSSISQEARNKINQIEANTTPETARELTLIMQAMRNDELLVDKFFVDVDSGAIVLNVQLLCAMAV